MARFDLETYRDRVRHAIDAEGLRPLARRTGLTVNQLRSIQDGRTPRLPTWSEVAAKLFREKLTFITSTQGTVSLYSEPLERSPEDESAKVSNLSSRLANSGEQLTGFVALPLLDALVSAGPGSHNHHDAVIDYVAFQGAWLDRMGISSDRAVLVRVRGDSMEPTLRAGDLVLIDQKRQDVSAGGVFAFVDRNGDTRVKRLERPAPDMLALRSDNPEHPLELRRGPELEQVSIIGQVVWSGHKWI